MNNEIEYKVKTVGDLRALVDAQRGFEADRKSLLELGVSAEHVEKQLEAVNRALSSQAARGVAAAQALDTTAKRIRQLGGDSSAIESARDTALAASGIDRTRRVSPKVGEALTAADMAQSLSSERPGKFKAAREAYKEAGGGLEGVKEAASVFGKGALAGATALVAGVEVAKKSLEQFAEAEERVAGDDAALAQRGQLTDEYREKRQKLAEELQRDTKIESEAWTSVMTLLTQFGASEGNIEKNIEAVKNLAGLLGGDLNGAAMMVGKALNGSFETFSRMGITFEENATQAEKLERLYTELANRGGGQLEARGQTLLGVFKGLKNSASDSFKAIGGGLADFLFLKEAISATTSVISFFNDIIGRPIPKVAGLKDAITSASIAMESAEEIAKRYEKQLENIKLGSDAAASATDRQIAAIRQLAALQQNVDEAQTASQVAQVDEDERTGKLSPLKAAQQRARLKEGAERLKLRREREAREAELKKVEEQSRFQVGIGDEANERVAKEAGRLREMESIEKGRAALKKKGDLEVEKAKLNYDNAPVEMKSRLGGLYHSEDTSKKIAASVALANTEREQRIALSKFDDEHVIEDVDRDGNRKRVPIDIQSQKRKVKEEQDQAKKINEEAAAKVLELNTRAELLRKEQEYADKTEKFRAPVRQRELRATIREGREKERGTAEALPGGGFSGSKEAVTLAQQEAADRAKVQQIAPQATVDAQGVFHANVRGDQNWEQLIRIRDAEIQRLTKVLEALSKQTNISTAQQALLRQIEDRLARLEQWRRN